MFTSLLASVHEPFWWFCRGDQPKKFVVLTVPRRFLCCNYSLFMRWLFHMWSLFCYCSFPAGTQCWNNVDLTLFRRCVPAGSSGPFLSVLLERCASSLWYSLLIFKYIYLTVTQWHGSGWHWSYILSYLPIKPHVTSWRMLSWNLWGQDRDLKKLKFFSRPEVRYLMFDQQYFSCS